MGLISTKQQNFGCDQIKSNNFAYAKLNVAKMTIFLYDRVENTKEKGENAALLSGKDYAVNG